MEIQEKAEILTDMLIEVQDKMLELDVKEFETKNEEYKISIVIDKTG